MTPPSGTPPSGTPPPVIQAAGGLLWRRAGDGVQVAVVHRPRHDDHSLPKGKLYPGELPLPGACREVVEETGYLPEPGPWLGRVDYRTDLGAKTVRYWSMSTRPDAEPDPGAVDATEVDQLRWVSPAEAIRLVSYRHDAQLIRRSGLLADPTALDFDTVVLLVRHARAGSRSEWRGVDDERPLDPQGQVQADQLRGALRCFHPAEVIVAEPLRCVQTLTPLATELALPARVEPSFNERAYAANPERTLWAIRDLVSIGQPVAVCSQGGVLPQVVVDLALADGAPVPQRPRARKGSCWALFFRDGRLRVADYYPDFIGSPEPADPAA